MDIGAINKHMKIKELTGYKTNPIWQAAKQIFSQSMKDVKLDLQFDQWREIMQKYEFRELGSGSFGSTYEKEGYPWIFKIFRNDPAYVSFFKYAKRNQSNPHLPKIKGGLIRINQDTFAVRIEKLREITRQEYQQVDDIINTFLEIIADERQSELEPKEEQLFKKYHNLYEIIYALWHSDAFKQTTFDFHFGNIMMRGQTPVIIDPVVAA